MHLPLTVQYELVYCQVSSSTSDIIAISVQPPSSLVRQREVMMI